MLIALLAAMTVLAAALVAIPLLRTPRAGGPRALHEIEIYRDQLDEVGRDVERGVIGSEQAEAARIEIGRRILALSDAVGPAEAASETKTATPPKAGWRLPAATVAAIAVPALALLIYGTHGRPDLPGRPAAELQAAAKTGAPSADLRARVAALARVLEADPARLPDWVALGDALTGLREHAKAAVAYGQAARLAPDSGEFLSRRAESLTFAADGQVTPAARTLFEEALQRDPGEPRAQFYLGVADRQAGKGREALDRWLALEAASPPDAPWLRFLQPRIASLALELGTDAAALAALRAKAKAAVPVGPAGSPGPSAATDGAPGPTREQVEAAQSMSAGDRSAMIRSMVDRLAARLAETPDDADGWMRLGRARGVLGEKAEAKAAYARAAALRPDDVAALGAWADSIVAAAEPAPPDAAELKPVIDRILAIDARNPRALWLAGALALSAGDHSAARRHWTLLLEALDPNSFQYIELKKQIGALPAG